MKKNKFLLLLSLVLVSCSNSNLDNFYRLYDEKNYHAALAHGEIALSDQGNLHTIWTHISADAKRANCTMLDKMLVCANIVYASNPTEYLHTLLEELTELKRKNCPNSSNHNDVVNHPVDLNPANQTGTEEPPSRTTKNSNTQPKESTRPVDTKPVNNQGIKSVPLKKNDESDSWKYYI